MSYSKKFYVQDTRSIVGNSAVWWCWNGHGYTCDLAEAGIYTEEEIRMMRDTDKPWPVDAINRLVQSHVDVQDLHKDGLPLEPHTRRRARRAGGKGP